jgi:predicted RNase H-like HicB family nuclease
MTYNFTVLIEQGEDGAYIATVPALKSCYTQADTIPELYKNIKEVIELCLEVENDVPVLPKFIGVQQMEIVI